MDTTEPRIDDILTAYFSTVTEGQVGATRSRTERVERWLRRCVEAEGDRMLDDVDYAILALERAVQPEAAVARTMRADALLWVLAVFLIAPWRMGDRLALALQLQVAEELAKRVIQGGLVCVACAEHPLSHIRDGLSAGRQELHRLQAQRRRAAGSGRR